MGDRRYAVNRAGIRVGVDVGTDMDEATFEKLVADGDLTLEEKKPAKKSAAKPSEK